MFPITCHRWLLIFLLCIVITPLPGYTTDTLRAYRFLQIADSLDDKALYGKARPFYQKAAAAYGNECMWGRAIQCINWAGDKSWEIGDYPQAKILYDSASHLANRHLATDHPAALQTALGYAFLDYFKDDFEGSIARSEVLVPRLKRRLGEESIELARAHNMIGISYGKKGDYDRAATNLERSLEIRRAVLGEKNSLLVPAYFNLANAFDEKGDHEKALYYFRQSLQLCIELTGPENLNLFHIYMGFGRYYAKQKQHETALAYQQKALKIGLRHLGEESPLVAYCYQNIGECLLKQQQAEEAIKYFKLAVDLRENKLSKKYSERLALSYKKMGNSYHLLGDTELRDYYYDKSLNMLESLGSKRVALSQVYLSKARIAHETGACDKALTFIQQAMTACVYDFEHEEESLGEVDFSNPNLDQVLSRPDLLEALKLKGDCLEQMVGENSALTPNLLPLAFETYELAAQLIDLIRLDLSTEAALQALSAHATSIYEGGIRTAWKLRNASIAGSWEARAFVLAEKSKAYCLLKAFHGHRAQALAQLPDSLLEYERTLKVDLAYYQSRLLKAQTKGDTTKTAHFEWLLVGKRIEYQQFVEDLSQNYSAYYHYKYPPQIASLSTLREVILSGNTTLVAYFSGSQNLYAFKVSAEGLTLTSLGDPKTLVKPIQQFRRALTDRAFLMDSSAQAYDQLTTSGYALYQKLLAPLVPDPSARLLIVPDGQLNYLPFELLLTDLPADKAVNYHTVPYLLKTATVSYSPSTQLLYETIGKVTSPQSQGFLAFATGSAPRGHAISVAEGQRGRGEALPGTYQEIMALSHYFEGKYLVGHEATKANFLTQAPHCRMLHLAMHAKVDNGHPLYSRLNFAKTSTADSTCLYAYELNQMRLQAELVVLSGCETGVGSYQKGEGVMSLARSFMYAGSPSLVISLWEIEDRCSAEVMQHYYRGLKEGLGKDEALRQAKLTFLEEADALRAHPFFWGAFAAMGNAQPLVRASIVGEFLRNNFGWISLLIVLGFCAFWWKFEPYKAFKGI